MSQTSSPRRKESSKIRQTMFEFLKRKKHIQLQNSFRSDNDAQRSILKANKPQSSNHKQLRESTKKHREEMADENSHTINDSIGIFSITQRNKYTDHNYHCTNITPKKITFSDNFQTLDLNKNSARRPLIQMISPLKNQLYSRASNINNSEYTRQMNKNKKKYENQNEKSKGVLKTSSFIKSDDESFTKKKLNSSFNTLKNIFLSLFESGKRAKQKSSSLSICLVNLVKDLNLTDKMHSKYHNYLDCRKLGEIRLILKSIQSALEHYSDNNQAEELIEQFHLNLAEHLNSIESINNEIYQKQFEVKIRQIQKQKNQHIESVEDKNQKLSREIERNLKKTQRIQNQLQKIKQEYQKRQQNLLQNIQTIKHNFEQKQTIYQEQIYQLKQIIKDNTLKSNQTQKQFKDYVYSQEKSIKLDSQTRINQQSARESFLLEEVQRLKQQFSREIPKVHVFYQNKMEQNDKKIIALDRIIEDLKSERTCDRSVSDRILEEANFQRKQKLKVSKKNEQILTDLYRMNEQLYQHWLALKDIKTLSERLHVFQHFQRIYCDLDFNSHLFES